MGQYRLIESSRIIDQGKVTGSILNWSSGRIGAEITKDHVTICRQYGSVGNRKIILSLSELGVLGQLCLEWQKERDNWAAFFYSSGGYPTGMGGAWYYLAPGKDSRSISVGKKIMHTTTGEEFCGQEQERLNEIWRVGEKYGNPAGELVGMIYQLSPTLKVEARRRDLKIISQGTWTTIEAYNEEVDFIHQLSSWARNLVFN